MSNKIDIFNSTLDICTVQYPAKCDYVIGAYDGIKICGNKESCQYVMRCELKEAEGGKNDAE